MSNLIDVMDGDAVTVDALDTSVASEYWILTKRIYRINQSTSGAQYQFVAEIPISQVRYEDSLYDSELGEVLQSTEWDGPPDGIEGIIALPNGVLAGFVGNLVCFSVPYYPHAWPVAYRKATERNVKGLASWGNTVLVLTEGQPYGIIGNDPANMVMEKIESGRSCSSKAGIIDMGEVVVYPCPEGLMAASQVGVELITEGVITADQWASQYSPTTIKGFYWQGKYIGFYNGEAGFIFDLKTRDLVDLDFYATAGFYDRSDGTLYLMVGSNIVSFATATTYRTMSYLTKKFRFPFSSIGCVKVLASSYPVTIDLIYRGIPHTVVITVESDNPTRLPTYLVDNCEMRIYGGALVSEAVFASTMEEILL